MATSKKAANAAQAVLDANRAVLVGFDTKVVKKAFVEMANAVAAEEAAKDGSSTAAVRLIEHAHAVAKATEAEGGTDIGSGWTKNVKAMYAELAKAAPKFIKASEKKPGAYMLTGYGQNVNSIAKGFCDFPDLNPEDFRAEDGTLTYGKLREAVIERRREDETSEQKAYRSAVEDLSEMLKQIRAKATKGQSAALVNVYVTELAKLASAEVVDEDEAEIGTDEVSAEIGEIMNNLIMASEQAA